MSLVRPNFYFGQLVDAELLSRIVAYADGLARQQNMLVFGTGVRRGLDVRSVGGRQRRVHVSAGFGVDDLGRAVVIDSDYTLMYRARFDGAVIARIDEVGIEPVPLPVGDLDVQYAAVEVRSVVELVDHVPAHALVLASIQHGKLVASP